MIETRNKKFILLILITIFSLSACKNHNSTETTPSTSVEESKDIIESVQISAAVDTFLWPKGLPRVASDDIYFTPAGNDYAYFVESQDSTIGNHENLAALLYEFDESGKVYLYHRRRR